MTLHQADCLDVLRAMPDDSADAVVTDPPYGLGFMGKDWDDLPPGEPWARECLRVLKPGGHLLAFGGTRTAHRLACAIEDAGFELRDTIAWLYGSGFPKSHNLGGEWQGWGTALKPAHEPIIVARKPLAGTVAANVLTYGTGGLNIDACRTATDDPLTGSGTPPLKFGGMNHRPFHDRRRDGEASADRRYTDEGGTDFAALPGPRGGDDRGRWPPNVVLDPETAADLDRESGTLTSGKPGDSIRGARSNASVCYADMAAGSRLTGYGDSGGASRFFPTFRYEAKAPADERPRVGETAHPTVKPLDLMRWLVRLVTPPGGLVLEPFAGSGTTAEACIVEGFRCIAIEREADYIPLILARITKPIEPVLFGESA